ncbi:UNVERIFIED_CONTAM: hypothetical protein PYX00_007109 [Menopon gallinae]|uniref:Kazal-like domain-containing protein n=1 Tax=Menopon gallinae TaxID=328185 RepID=A0AAW2HHG4_9NEOP
MHATLTELILLLAVGGALSRQTRPQDVIWFPIEDIKGGYESTLGEVYVTKAPNDWLRGRIERTERYYRHVNNDDYGANNLAKTFWETEATPPPVVQRLSSASEPIVFPEEFPNESPEISEDCLKNCPQTFQYNPVCGSDFLNYHNIAALKCAQLCGKSVRFAHYGICGRSLPGIFVPSPRRPRQTTPWPW